MQALEEYYRIYITSYPESRQFILPISDNFAYHFAGYPLDPIVKNSYHY